MKKLLAVSMILVSLVSCKEKLPPIVQEQVDGANKWEKTLDSNRLIISKMSKNDIDNLSLDSLYTIKFNDKLYLDLYRDYRDKLLKIVETNPNYSNNDEVEHIIKPIADKKEYDDYKTTNKIIYIENLYNHKRFTTLYPDEPKWEN
jgi:hypothetical protein